MGFSLRLLPKDDRFFDLICLMGELANKAVHLIRELIHQSDESKKLEIGQEIRVIKSQSKDVSYEITEKLCRALVTPFDHEDIHRLSRGMYKILKICEKTQERILAFHLEPWKQDFDKLTANMVEVSDVVRSVIENLKFIKDSKPIHDKCAVIHNIEAKTDKLLDKLIIDLYKHETDFKSILIRKEMYELMEDIVDRHRNVANVILEIVLKHT